MSGDVVIALVIIGIAVVAVLLALVCDGWWD